MRFLAIALLAVACHREVKSDLRIDETDKDNSAKTAEETSAKTKKQDPSEVDTKTTKSDNAVVVQAADGSSTIIRVPKNKPLTLKPGAKVVGTVPLTQTTVDQSRHIGASVDEKTSTKKSTETDDKDKNVKTASSAEDMSDVGFSLKFYLLAGGLLAAVAALGVFLARSRLVRRLLGVPL